MQKKAPKTAAVPEKKLSDLAPNEKNPRKISDKKLEMLKKSMARFGSLDGIVYNRALGRLVGGHQRQKAAEGATVQVERQFSPPTATGTVAEGFIMLDGERYPYREVEWDEATDKAANIAANKGAGQWDFGQLSEWMLELDANNFDLNLTMFDEEERENLLTHVPNAPGGPGAGTGSPTMVEKFGVPPFTVLDARQGYWKSRKKEWLAMGIKSEEGRKHLETTVVQTEWMQRGAAEGGSIFDPVLCELVYRWFCPGGGTILDPFAGGSVRGIVASALHRQYVGVDLRAEQVEANRDQAQVLCSDPMPVWETGDSMHIARLATGVEADLVFTCPPYADLEVYSDEPADISNMEYVDFLAAYKKIIAEACGMLKKDRFAAVVVGDVRDKKGIYRNFVAHTIEAFIAAGLSYYNEAILVTPVGSLPLRAGRAFSAARKLGKTHQNLLVFVKGDPKKATEACGEIEIPDLTVYADEPEEGTRE